MFVINAASVQFHNHEYYFSPQGKIVFGCVRWQCLVHVGVSRSRPRQSEFGRLRESIHITSYERSLDSFLRVVDQLQETSFRAGVYNVLSCNCNHFSDALLKETCGRGIPEWVNRAANVGSGFASKKNTCEESFPALGVSKPPSTTAKIVDEAEQCDKNESHQLSFFKSVFDWIFAASSAKEGDSSRVGVVEKNHSGTEKKKKELTEKQKKILENIKRKT